MKTYFRVLIVMVMLMLVATGVLAQDETSGAGETVLLQGQLMDSDGNPIEGALIELWQTDASGNYDHPNDTDPSLLLDDFQYFGTATTDADGYYAFLTVKPSAYESRPPHLHYKVKIDGETVLTSQFYFVEDFEAVESDSVFGDGGETLFLDTTDSTDEAGEALRIATGNIVLDLNGADADTLTVTASQAEGPYYPVVDFSDYDNNLISTAEDDEIVLPMLNSTTEFTLFNMNTASGDDFLTIPNMSNRMVREFMEYRPYISIAQFRREIGKYVDQTQVAEYELSIYVPVDVNESDAATLMQIPGLDEAVAAALIAARPYADHDAFLTTLGELAPDVDLDYAVHYLDAE